MPPASIRLNLPSPTPQEDEFRHRRAGAEKKVWRDIWSAGQGVGNIRGVILPAEAIVAELGREYEAARARLLMTTLTASEARANLYRLIDEASRVS